MSSKVRPLLLSSDKYSPMSAPHGLPALYWPGLACRELGIGRPDRPMSHPDTSRGDGISHLEDRLQCSGWDPQWRFGMYKQAHYHSTTHELLTVVQASATIQLGGTDERARPPPSQDDTMPADGSATATRLSLDAGDVLLLPAGYSHRAVESKPGFTMIGAYPAGAEQWDMRFPNVMGCPYDVDKIKTLTQQQPRKGLYEGRSPDAVFGDSSSEDADLTRHWHVTS